mgnify:CR=1 FL=1
MTCTCLSEIEKDIIDAVKEDQDCFISGSIREKKLLLDRGTGISKHVLSLHFDFMIQKFKKDKTPYKNLSKETYRIGLKFCPFCGIKI